MALVLKDRVQEVSTTTGTGTLTLAGAVTQFQTFSSAIGNGNTTYYTIFNAGGTEWEVGLGTVGAGTLARNTVYASSNAGALVNFTGTLYVFCDYPAGRAVYANAAGAIHVDGQSYVDFETAPGTTVAAGRMWYNNTTGAWNLGMGGGNITQQIGEELYYYGKASSAITDSPLQIIYKTGTVGASGVITFAPTTTSITDGDLILGVATESIALNGFGRITTFGVVHGITTDGSAYGETWADGDTIWYNPITGNPTKNKPAAPNIKVQIGTILNAGSGGSGSIQVEINHGSVLGGTDSNVQITTPTAAQILTYDSSDQYWKNTSLASGTGISTTTNANGTLTVNNTGVTSAVAGTGISVSGSTGAVTVTNTAPDQTVVLTAGTGISTSGTYPSFTITNTAPDQTVALTAGTGISVSGTYPNFTVTNTSPSSGGTVTSVTGTAPVVSSGGTTPAISMAAANGSTNGYLTSTDWTTFNSKGSGTVTSVNLTASTGISVSGGPVTSSGSITVTNTAPMIYPGSGIPNSTGSAWGTSYTTSGSGTVVVLSSAPTITNPTVTNYTESVVSIGTVTSSNTLDLTNGTVQTATLTASTACTFTMPTATAGKSFVLLLKQAASTGNGTATFTGVKWPSAGAPTITATAGKMDILTFVADGTNWYGSYVQGYTP